MDEQGLRPPEISIRQKKKVLKAEMVRVTAFGRFKVMELITADHVPFYMVFYKDSLICGDQIKEIQEDSFIHKAFQKGIAYEWPHPVSELMAPQQPLTIPNKKKLFSQLQDHYSLQEIAYIAGTLDSFFEKDSLIEVIHDIYGHLKRNGQHFKAFQVIQKLQEFAPDSRVVKHQFHSPEFHSFQQMYADLPSLSKKDPLYFEQYCFENRANPNEYELLSNALDEQNRLLDATLLWIEAAEKQRSPQSVRKYTDIALQFVSIDGWMQILSKIKINPFKELSEARSFVESEIGEGKYEESVTLLLPFIDDLPDAFNPILQSLWTHLDTKFIADHLEHLIPALKKMETLGNEKSFNQILFDLAAHLFKENELEAVRQKLSPIEKIVPHSPALRKLDQMLGLSEDPDRMMELGKYYAEFKQYDQAIECFSWEMEFHPDESSPVWYLSKMYQYKGLIKEAEAYQQYFAELKKQS